MCGTQMIKCTERYHHRSRIIDNKLDTCSQRSHSQQLGELRPEEQAASTPLNPTCLGVDHQDTSQGILDLSVLAVCLRLKTCSSPINEIGQHKPRILLDTIRVGGDLLVHTDTHGSWPICVLQLELTYNVRWRWGQETNLMQRESPSRRRRLIIRGINQYDTTLPSRERYP